ncbi:hypothetical protein [Paracoccus sp. (in: a-proteobacteria)]|uniref:mannitol dehydrogenase family protein n=1 Tax=Paracoccus sp. TaxID=267 RepID=UPI003A4C717F
MKLRMLNGSHSTMAYLGYLAGYEYITDVMGDEDFVRLIHGLMTQEVMPTLDMPGVDLGAYRDKLLDRFRNPALKHRTWQIAMDGSQKSSPSACLPPFASALPAGQGFERLGLGVAAWMRYVIGIDEKGDNIDVRDPWRCACRPSPPMPGTMPRRSISGCRALERFSAPTWPKTRALPKPSPPISTACSRSG